MSRRKPEIIEVDTKRLDDVVHRAQESLNQEDAELIRRVFESYSYVADLVQDKDTSIRRLRQLMFGSRTEKTKAIMRRAADSGGGESGHGGVADQAEAKPPEVISDDETSSQGDRKGHGRNGADAYRGADRVEVAHENLKAGDPCPECKQGTVYAKSPGVVVRITGQAPLHATRYELEKLRCHLCGKVFTAQLPEAAGAEKYDAKAASMIALLKYGSGLPFNRLEGLQRDLEIPLPASTQWEIVHAFAGGITPAYEELIRQAAQGDVVHNDDTTVKILELMGDGKHKFDDESEPSRTGLYTSGIVSTRDGHRTALFFSGRRHAGENLMEVLKHRASELDQPIQMCDALSRNMPTELKTIVANCLAHGRRQFVDIHDRFPDECQYVLEELRIVFHNETITQWKKMSAEQRLRFHQENSREPMQRLQRWMNRQFDEKLVEPNSALGDAIRYLQKHWTKLTRFLEVVGTPLDNNICERALKKAILHRRNALFFKTRTGARVGDMYMSLIHTCELGRVNPFEYLTELQLHSDEVATHPADWMPWTYRATLDKIQTAA